MKGLSKAELLAQQEKLSKGFSPDLSAIEDNLSKLPEEMWEKQIAGFEKDNSQKTTEKSQQRTDEFNAKEEAKQVARQEKAAIQREKTVAERQRIDADFKAYDKQYAQYRTEMENQLEQSYQNGINRGGSAYMKGRQTSAIGGDFATEYDWKTLQADAATAKWNSNRFMRYALDYGQTNAIELETSIDINGAFMTGSIGLSVTFDNQGGLTFAWGYEGGVTTELGPYLSHSVGIVKGYGANSAQLGSGESVSTIYSANISDFTNSKFKGRDFGAFVEDGWTLDNGGKPEFRIEGYGVSQDFNIFDKALERFSPTPSEYKGLPVEAIKSSETAKAIGQQRYTNYPEFSRAAYGMLNVFFFK